MEESRRKTSFKEVKDTSVQNNKLPVQAKKSYKKLSLTSLNRPSKKVTPKGPSSKEEVKKLAEFILKIRRDLLCKED